MSSKFQCFGNFLESKEFKTSNQRLREVIDGYSFFEISEKKLEQDSIIAQNLDESKLIIISHYDDHEAEENDLYFILSFKKTILVIKETRIKTLQTLLSQKEELKICFLFNTKEIYDKINDEFKEIKIKYDEIQIDESFLVEVEEFNKNFFNGKSSKKFPHDDFLKNIKSCISGYLIKQSSYAYDRINNFNTKAKDGIIPREITEDEIIELRLIGTGSTFKSVLYYHIEYEKLVVIKKCNSYNSEIEKLVKREIRNYEEINHPFIPKFYGTIQYDNLFYPVVEFINGKTLKDTNFSQFSETEIYEIIFQLLLVINYLHNNNFIYRDLKPNNVIIDENKNLALIDFDRMIKKDENTNTNDFQSSYVSPEINKNDFTNKCDIYSIGKIMEFLMFKSGSVVEIYKNTKMIQMYIKCINDKAEMRPNSSELINDFILSIIKNINIHIDRIINYLLFSANQNISQAQFQLGLIYKEGKYILRDINKSIYYFEKAANQNDPDAQFYLGLIYYNGQCIPQDINKSIYYFEKAANQNDPDAQFYLGSIYYEGKYIPRDINKSIYYFEKVANQNFPKAQFNLGLIYEEGKYISRDINKSIYYYSLAADQNHPKAQYNLGSIYYEGKYISRDINKAIYYFEKVANQNDPKAQYNLGLIYEEGQYISRDINKSIYYYSLAANQNDSESQYNLGNIYYSGQYISRDINKSIYYFEKAANQNDPNAQYNLGLIYYKGQYISRDINKSIYYFEKAANQNIPQAQFYLGIIYYEGQYIPQDINKSIYYLSLAANQNESNAQYNLGLIYYEGKYIPQNINKSMYYYSLAANKNNLNAQFQLGFIYYLGQYIPRDINKSIYYFEKVANQNHPFAQFNLGLIYYEGKYISRDINKSIYYFEKSANQNDSQALYNLGLIYYEGKYISRDINKSIYYLSLAANQNHPKAQYILGLIYYEGKYISRDINKSIYYFEKAANLNFPQAQYNLGLIYYYGIGIKQNIKRGIYWITQSSNNDCIEAHFTLGFLYQEGKCVKRSIEESIKYYKKASSFNIEYAKNNLGIIYKNNFEKKYDYTVYFKEAIQQKNDPVSMYNLSHAYIYEYQEENLINKSIELLIKSLNLGFKPSIELLSLIILKRLKCKPKNDKKNNEKKNIIHLLIDKNKNAEQDIEKELSKFTKDTRELVSSIISIIQEQQLYDQSIFEQYYQKYEEIEFIYDLLLNPVCIKDLLNENEIKLEGSQEEYNITSDFYEGFGQDIYQKQ